MSQRVIEPLVLNAGRPAGARVPLTGLAGELRERLADLVARHADPAGGLVDYRGLAVSAGFAALVALTRHLPGGRPDELSTLEEQIAFWVNLYNVLTVHAITALGIHDGVGEIREFFKHPRYDVGGEPFALVDIEHGVLRRNRTSRNMPVPVWKAGDPRHRWMVARVDPRVHFTLMCGARSCPPIRAYEARRLDAQLDLATRAFVNGDVEVDPERGSVRLSRIYYWYEEDFGDVLGWVLRYLDPGPGRDWLARHAGEARAEYRSYEWELNDLAGWRPGAA